MNFSFLRILLVGVAFLLLFGPKSAFLCLAGRHVFHSVYIHRPTTSGWQTCIPLRVYPQAEIGVHSIGVLADIQYFSLDLMTCVTNRNAEALEFILKYNHMKQEDMGRHHQLMTHFHEIWGLGRFWSNLKHDKDDL